MNHSYIDDIYISERLECELYEHDRLCFKYKLNPDKVFRGFYCFNMNDSRYLFYDYEFYHDENLHDFISCFSKTFDIYYHELFNIQQFLTLHKDALQEYVVYNGNHIHINDWILNDV